MDQTQDEENEQHGIEQLERPHKQTNRFSGKQGQRKHWKQPQNERTDERTNEEKDTEQQQQQNPAGKYIYIYANTRSNAKECIVNSTTIYSHLERLCKMHFKIIKGIIEYIKLNDDDNDDDEQ